MSHSASDRLAAAAANVQTSSLRGDVRTQARDLFLDTLAVIAAGLTDPDYSRFTATLTAETGDASVPGVSHGVPVANAVQINGGATTVLQLQDGHRLGRGHPVSHMAPALLALAETTDASADAVCGALVAGYEVGARIGMAMNGFNEFLHDTGTWSTIGTAVACSHLLSKGDAAAIARAIETAAATALMPYRDLPLKGASAHHTYTGLGAMNGVIAAQSAIAGLVPVQGSLDAFFGPRAGAAFKASELTQGLSADDTFTHFEILNAYFKVHPTCAHLHGANDALLQLMSQHAFTAADVERMEIATYASGLSFDNPAPHNALSARFSQAAAAAIAVCCGALDETTLTDDMLARDDVQALIKRITVAQDPALDAGYPAGRPARVTIALSSGGQLSASAHIPRGDGGRDFTAQDRRDKALRLLTRRFDHHAAAVLAACDSYWDGDEIGVLSHALRS